MGTHGWGKEDGGAETWSVTGLMGLWDPWSTQIFRDKNKKSPWLMFKNFPYRLLFGSFTGFSLHSAPPHCLVTLWEQGAYLFVSYPQIRTLPVCAPFLKCKVLKFLIYRLKSLTHKAKREATSEWKNSIFVSFSLQELRSGFLRGSTYTGRADSICV